MRFLRLFAIFLIAINTITFIQCLAARKWGWAIFGLFSCVCLILMIADITKYLRRSVP